MSEKIVETISGRITEGFLGGILLLSLNEFLRVALEEFLKELLFYKPGYLGNRSRNFQKNL